MQLSPAGGGVSSSLTWQVTARDWCSTTWALAQTITNLQTGAVTPQTSRVIRVGTGLNYLDPTGVWRQSEDLIELTADGGAAAVRGPHQVYFSAAGLTDDAALTIVTLSNRVFQSRVLGVYYFEPASGRSRLLAAPSGQAVAELHPPNQIVYRSAFNSEVLKADLRYTCAKSGFESELILTAQPKLSPSDCGFDAATALLQVRHQWLAPTPRIKTITVGSAAGPEVTDQILDFGDLWFPSGRAFLTDGSSSTDTNVASQISVASPGGDGAGVPVAKQWQSGGATNTLTESVAWRSIAPELAGLPPFAGPDFPGLHATAVPDQGLLFPARGSVPRSGIRLAGAPYGTAGLTVNYQIISGGGQSLTFQTQAAGAGPQYLIDGSSDYGPAYFGGSVIFEPGCLIQYVGGAYLLLYGGVVCQGTPASPSVMTSGMDGQYGLLWSPWTGPASAGDAGTALWLYYIDTNVTLSGMCVRYATTGIECNGNCGPGPTNTVANCALYMCQTGLKAASGNLDIQNSFVNSVTYPTSYLGGALRDCGVISGSFGQGSCPSPTFEMCDAILLGDTVSFNQPASPPTVVAWYLRGAADPYLPPTPVGAGTNVTLSGTQGLTTYGIYNVYAGISNPYGSNFAHVATLDVADAFSLNVLHNFLNSTNGKTPSIWSNLPMANPPAGMAWNNQSLIYGWKGFTAISQQNNWTVPPYCYCPGQIPVTALTKRHGYTRGHGFGFDNPPYYGAFDFYGTFGFYPPVWFCTANNELVTSHVAYSYTRNYGPYDYTVLIFTRDLPPGITPMQVGAPSPAVTVQLAASQYAVADVAGSVWAAGLPCGFAPFQYTTPPFPVLGESGAPVMLPADDGVLVFLYGVGAASGPSAQMQADMDTLCLMMTNRNQHLDPKDYQMTWHATQ